MRKVVITGGSGLVGSSIASKLSRDHNNCLFTPKSTDVNLLDEHAVRNYLNEKSPEIVIASAAFVGGIAANQSHKFQFIYKNLQMQNNLIGIAAELRIPRLIFVSSSCIYPRSEQALSEEDYFFGAPEENTRPYGIAKIAGMELVKAIRDDYGLDYVSIVPCNLYGPNDNFDPRTSHVIPSLLHKFHSAKANNLPQVDVWGSADTSREFLYVEDLANAISLLLVDDFKHDFVNVGSDTETTIGELASLVAQVTNYQGGVVFDPVKPSGIDRKKMNSKIIRALGWKPQYQLTSGLEKTYHWMLSHIDNLRKVDFSE